MTNAQFLEVLHRAIRAAGSQKELAAQLGVSQQYLSDVRRGRRDPGPSMLEALGLRKHVTYTKAE